MQIVKRRGAPTKIPEMGKTRRYAPVNVPKELIKYFKASLKKMMSQMTMADYLRARVVYDASKRLKGQEYEPSYCAYNGMIDWKEEAPWIKNPHDKVRYTSPVHYPLDEWEIFKHNCSVVGICPKHAILRYMIDLVNEYIALKKITRRHDENSKKTSTKKSKTSKNRTTKNNQK